MTVFPTPLFEGAEKRLELDFDVDLAPPREGRRGLRNVPSAAWNDALREAECCIVSAVSNSCCDAYLLSESSLFVFEDKIMVKTCGTTKILAAVPALVSLACSPRAGAGRLARCKYTRASFLRPDLQPAPHRSFEEETRHLDSLFGHLSEDQGGRGQAFVLGDQVRNALWHVYVSGSARAPTPSCHKPFSLEVCMTGLDAAYCAHFVRAASIGHCEDEEGSLERRVREASSICDLLPGCDALDDYVFDPCGYSLNAVQGTGLLSIHITPQEACSYASVEFSGFACPGETGGLPDPDELVRRIHGMFKPEVMCVAASSACPEDDVSAFFRGKWMRGVGKGGAGSWTRSHSLGAWGEVAFQTLAARAEPRRQPLLRSLAPCGATQEGRPAGEVVEVGSKPASPCSTLEGSLKPGAAGRDLFAQDSSQDEAGSDSSELSHLTELSLSTEFPAEAAAPMHEAACEPIGCSEDVASVAAGKIARLGLEDTFYVTDLGNVHRRLRTWRALLPTVHPFYAVKCNPDPGILSLLASLGCGFDCASSGELEQVLALGVGADRVVFANACKRPCDLRSMSRARAGLTTFDTASELRKIARAYPQARLLLRIRADDPTARCRLGNKYGAEMHECAGLLQLASDLGLSVAGVSFHVGSGANDPEAFRYAIRKAAECMRLGDQISAQRFAEAEGEAEGGAMRVLDIGGGFAGGDGDGTEALLRASRVINETLEECFPSHGAEQRPVRVIAEPGRFFAEGACSLFTRVFGKRERCVPAGSCGNDAGVQEDQGANVASAALDASGTRHLDYWITDGLYGSMNCVLYDHATLEPRALRVSGAGEHSDWSDGKEACEEDLCPCTLFGPTCDGLDVVCPDARLPEMRDGDWVYFPRMGAYTLSAASDFNGFCATSPAVFYVFSEREGRC